MSQIPTLSGGVNLWGASPLYVNPVNMLNILTKVLSEGKGGIMRNRLKEADNKLWVNIHYPAKAQ